MTTPGDISKTADSTSNSLLEGLRMSDALAWEQFKTLYAPVVYAWCRGYVQPAEAEDVSQEVFLAIMRRITDFQRRRSGSFRAWLWTVTRNKLTDHARKEGRYPRAPGGTDFLRSIEQISEEPPMPSDPAMDSDRAVVQRAMELIRPTISDKTWEAFLRMIRGNETAADIAADLGLKQAAVRMAKYRVKKKLRDVLEGMIDLDDGVFPGD